MSALDDGDQVTTIVPAPLPETPERAAARRAAEDDRRAAVNERIAKSAEPAKAAESAATRHARHVAAERVVKYATYLEAHGVTSYAGVTDEYVSSYADMTSDEQAKSNTKLAESMLKAQRDALAKQFAADAMLPTSDRSMLVDGGSFIFDQPDGAAAIWGRGDDVLWAEGEALMIAGAQGLGKTTLAGLLVDALITGGSVLGYGVVKSDRPILYLAMDRPQQAARSLRRQLTHLGRDVLAERLIVWQGPPEKDLAANPELLADLAQRAGAGTVIIDSLKDAALRLNEDATGSGWNRARQLALIAGVAVAELHHIKKIEKDARPSLADVYGSTWLTSGCGSVLLFAGEATDPIVKLFHVKPPVREVGPFDVLREVDGGGMTVRHGVDLYELAIATDGGLTARIAAEALYEKTKPTKNEVEKARRRLDRLVADGMLRQLPKTSRTSEAKYVDSGDVHAGLSTA